MVSTYVTTVIDRTEGCEARPFALKLKKAMDPLYPLAATISIIGNEPRDLIEIISDEIRPFSEFLVAASSRFGGGALRFDLGVAGPIEVMTDCIPNFGRGSDRYRCQLSTCRSVGGGTIKHTFEFVPEDLCCLGEALMGLGQETSAAA